MRRDERLRALFAGEEVDRPPFTLFFHLGHHHFRKAAAAVFAEQEVQLFDNYGFDFMKVMNDFPHPMPEGVEVIEGPEDLLRMEAVEIRETPFSHQLQAIAILNRELAAQRGCPFWDTLFNPWFTIRRHLLGDDIYRYMQEHPRALHHALDVVTENSIRYAAASIAEGAQGMYLSVPAATEYVTQRQYLDFMRPYDERLVQGIRRVSEGVEGARPVLVIHIHGGGETFFSEVVRLRPDAIGWADKFASPSIEAARGLFDGVLMTGIDHKQINYLPFPALAAQIKEAVRVGGNRRFILAPGCVIPTHCPERIVRFVTRIATAPAEAASGGCATPLEFQ